MSWGMAAAALAPTVLSMIGNQSGKGSDQQSQEYMQKALEEISRIQIPEQRAMRLEELRSAGILTPEVEQAYRQSDSELQGISLDPQMRDAQMSALSGLQEIGQEGGMNLQDRSRLNQVLGNFNTANKGQQDAVKQSFARRGMGGSGSELAAALNAQQSNVGTAAQQSLGVEAMAQQRALEGLIQAGNMGGNIRSQDYGEQAKAAEAQDLINRFNVANRQDVGMRNTASMNNAQASNLQNKQNIMNDNVGLRNQATQYNLQADQRNFDNQMKKATPMVQGQQNMAGMYNQQGQNTRDMWSGAGQGIGQAAGAYANYQNNQDYLDRRYPQQS